MKYCIYSIYDKSVQHVTEEQFWNKVFQQCMFGSQADVDNIERCLYLGHKICGTTNMFFFEDVDPETIVRVKEEAEQNLIKRSKERKHEAL